MSPDSMETTEHKETPEAPETTPSEDGPDRMREKWLRALADLDNARKRSATQVKTAVQNERKAILGAFLEILDSLEMALKAHEGEHNEWTRGTLGIYRQTLKTLKRFGVEPFDVMGTPFDPNLHEAVGQTPAPDKPENTVVQVLQGGFRLQDGSLLRPAKVIVSRAREADSNETGTAQADAPR